MYNFNFLKFTNYKNETKIKMKKIILKSAPSLVAQMVKNPPTMQKALIQSLGQEEPLEDGMATHSSILAWRISWMEEPSRL